MQSRTFVACLLSSSVVCAWPASGQDPKRSAKPPSPFAVARDETLRKAQVWTEPATPIESAKLGENPGGADAFSADEVVTCRFKPVGVGGSTPKFDCELPSGEKVKVKYGPDNPELYAEVAASRLLAALGFPADRMYVVERVRCFGCPKDPFPRLECFYEESKVEVCFPDLDYTRFEDFEHAVIERTVEGRRIETREERGWAWHELEKIDPAAGGATRAQVDALRLLAVMLSHWDNKAKNQRLICLDDGDSSRADDDSAESAACNRPLAMVTDLGATFGPDKVDLKNWAATPIWTNATTCEVSMRALPYGGSSFRDTRISEQGRAFLGERLGKLSAQQIRELFEGARVQHYPHENAAQRDVDNWGRAFQDKVRAIVDRAPCPKTE